MTYYFTFGVGDPLHSHRFVKIESEDRQKARNKMFELFGNKWAFDYDNNHWNLRKNSSERQQFIDAKILSANDPREVVSQAEIFNLTELKFND